MSCSIEPAPPTEFLTRPLIGLKEALPASFAVSGANFQPVQWVVRLAAPVKNPLALPAPPLSRAEMVPQGIEKAQFAPEIGASLVALSGVEPAPQAFAFVAPMTSRRNSQGERAGAVRHLRTSSRGAHCLRRLGSKDARCPPGAHLGSCIF